jgi:heme-degrading monooxygenase HmoA
MFATIRKYQGKPGTINDVAQQVQHEFVPLLSAQPGFVSYTAVHTGNDAVISVSVFQDKAAAEAANKVAAEWVKKHIAPQVGSPETSWGEVVATDNREL